MAAGTVKQFHYRAVAADGAVRTGLVVAANGAGADRALFGQGLSPINVTERAHKSSRWNRPTGQELALAVRSVAALVAAGAPLRVAMETAESLAARPGLKASLAAVGQDVVEGQTLASALERSGLLTPAMLGVVRAGERAGRLELALAEAASLLEAETAAAARLQRALMYPTILLVAGVASTALISLLVVPRFAALLADVGRTLPPATRILIAITTALRTHGLIILVGAASAAALTWRWAQSTTNRETVHRFVLDLPVLGRFRLAAATARICRSLGGALQAGSPLIGALEIARESLADLAVQRRLERAIPRVASGSGLTNALVAEAVLLPSVVPLVGLGESNGRLGAMVLEAAKVSGTEADRLLDASVALIEPTLVLALGSLIAFVAAAMFQAVYSLGPAT